MSDVKPRPSIFLYTDDAEITEELRALMIDAGYLPVRVANMDTVRIMPTPTAVDMSEIPAITIAALNAVLKSAESTNAHVANFGESVARLLLANKQR